MLLKAQTSKGQQVNSAVRPKIGPPADSCVRFHEIEASSGGHVCFSLLSRLVHQLQP